MPGGGTLTIDTENVAVDDDFAAARPALSSWTDTFGCVSSDTGSGMSRDVLDRAFEPFFTTKAKGEGSGLGLATVYGIITQAGGYAEIYSEPGLGTTFTALLPATDQTPVRRRASSPEPCAPSGRRDRPGRRGRGGDARGHPTNPDPQRPQVLVAGSGEEAITLAVDAPGAHRPTADRRDHAAHARQGGRRADRGHPTRTSGCCTCRATPNPSSRPKARWPRASASSRSRSPSSSCSQKPVRCSIPEVRRFRGHAART